MASNMKEAFAKANAEKRKRAEKNKKSDANKRGSGVRKQVSNAKKKGHK